MKSLGFDIFVAVFVTSLTFGCDNRVPCDEETFESYCDGNTLVVCGGYLDEKNYTDETWVTPNVCPAEQPYCVTTDMGGVCSMFESDRGYCGTYPKLGRYCVDDVFTECGRLAITSQYTCPVGTFCGHYDCRPLPEIRDAELWQGCDEACGEKICRNTDIMGPYSEAPELPIEVWVGGATGYFDLEDGSRLYFDGCHSPGPPYPVDAIAQHCFCYDPP
jgi:hypothetical protein